MAWVTSQHHSSNLGHCNDYAGSLTSCTTGDLLYIFRHNAVAHLIDYSINITIFTGKPEQNSYDSQHLDLNP